MMFLWLVQRRNIGRLRIYQFCSMFQYILICNNSLNCVVGYNLYIVLYCIVLIFVYDMSMNCSDFERWLYGVIFIVYYYFYKDKNNYFSWINC